MYIEYIPLYHHFQEFHFEWFFFSFSKCVWSEQWYTYLHRKCVMNAFFKDWFFLYLQQRAEREKIYLAFDSQNIAVKGLWMILEFHIVQLTVSSAWTEVVSYPVTATNHLNYNLPYCLWGFFLSSEDTQTCRFTLNSTISLSTYNITFCSPRLCFKLLITFQSSEGSKSSGGRKYR